MLGVDARSVAVGWFVVVISIVRLEAGQRSAGQEATINRALGLLPKPPAKIPGRRCHGGGQRRNPRRGTSRQAG